jgi:hypothetical protein
MSGTIIKACHSCREYVRLDASFEAQKLERAFDNRHRGHMVQVVQLNEVKDKYTEFEG